MKNFFPFFKAKKKESDGMDEVYAGPEPRDEFGDEKGQMRAVYAAPVSPEPAASDAPGNEERMAPPIALVYAGPGQMNRASGRNVGQDVKETAEETIEEPIFFCVYAGPAFMTHRDDREETIAQTDAPAEAKTDAPAPAPKDVPERTPSAPPVLLCPVCQTEVTASARFCSECGGKLPDHCLRCGRILVSRESACPVCGVTCL